MKKPLSELEKSLTRFQEGVSSIQESLKLSDDQILSLSNSDKDSFKSLSLNLVEIHNLANHLKLLPESIFNNSFCPETLKQHYYGNKSYISTYWLEGGGSTVSCLNNALSLTSYKVRERVLRKFQITEEFLREPKQRIGVHLLGQVINEISQQQMNPYFAYEVGELSCKEFSQTKTFQNLRALSCPKEVYKRFISEVIKKIESNMHYSIEEDFGNSIVISYRPQKVPHKLLSSLPDKGTCFDLFLRGFLEEFHLFCSKEKVKVRNYRKALNSKHKFLEVVFS